jgi:hypothetical protein
MLTIKEITLAHSRRLSEIHRTRDIRLAEAHAFRDVQLRSVPAAAKAYREYDQELAGARIKQGTSDDKAEAARSIALLAAIEHRGELLEDAHTARRSTDTKAVESKRHDDAAANHKYDTAMKKLRESAEGDRLKVARDAERQRQDDREEARRVHDAALDDSQEVYRGAVDRAMLVEFRESREGERAYLEALGLAEAAARGARTSAEENLSLALANIPEARRVLIEWRSKLATIVDEAKAAEAEAFVQFRDGLDSLHR